MRVTRSIVQSYIELTDVLVAIGIIGVVVTIALGDYRRALTHVELIEVPFLVSGIRVDLHEYRATHGAWPDRDGVSSHSSSRSIEDERGTNNVRVGGEAALHFTMALMTTSDAGVLSYRAAVVPGNASSSIIWTCGFAPVREGFVAPGTNETTFADALLPSPCRQGLAPTTKY
ncbi:type II secretory pathway pseudopilin PulG [Povalibacter uvarum]|uniref:Type II secretory pathway pseudopilin PulG n=1 Tax=Povalibacter uvarum TaxID=732238 RepID=A0A841HQQ4_9GAMM|nr:pilin [Povalibacter uvarum]MBB6095547.1 type II secretory pathway pseudopilin PulG [Povalibacter uvarum]